MSKLAAKPETVRVGFLEGATYPDGTSVASVALWQEFGTKTAPPRPFFRTMIATKSDGWGEQLAGALRANGMNVAGALDTMSQIIKGELQESIVDMVDPPLRPITLMLRQMRAADPSLVVTGRTVAEAAARIAAGETPSGVSVKPLVDTGHLLNSVDYEVNSGRAGR